MITIMVFFPITEYLVQFLMLQPVASNLGISSKHLQPLKKQTLCFPAAVLRLTDKLFC